MNLRTKLSLTLNALLLGCVVWLTCAAPQPKLRADSPHHFTKRGPRTIPQITPPPNANEPLPEVIVVSEAFDWAQLESADYFDYMANLRSIGCPEPTVRDIINADVNELFTTRVKALVDEVTGRFWELIIRPDDFDKMVEDKHGQLRALGDERDAIFTALFGDSDPHSAENLLRYTADQREHWERIGDFLSEEKCARFVAAQEEFERAWTVFMRTSGMTGVRQQTERKRLEAALQQSLRAELTPDEYNEVVLRQSPAASLRDRLVGLDLSEEIVRAAANIQFANAAAPSAIEAQTRELIGQDGYAVFKRATDSRYEPIYRLTQRLGLPDATAAQAYDIRQQAEGAARGVHNNKSLIAEQRQAMLQAISAETKQSLSTSLGPNGFAAYEKMDARWLTQLTSQIP